jgi:hypothetical protein
MAAPELMPNLQLVPVERVRFHEHPEHRRTLRLMERIEQEAVLRNTPVVADMDGGDFLLLDGANRVSAFKELGFSHVPVQVVDYGDERIQLKGWHHLLVNGRALNLREAFDALDGVTLRAVPQERLTRLLELHEVFAVWVDETTACWGLFPEAAPGTIEIHERIAVMDRIVAAYEGQSKLERIKLADFSQLPEVIRSVDHQLCLFPVLTKNELLQVAREKVMIPTGLTRHLIPGRALGINLQLGFLEQESSEAEKKRYLQDYVDRLEMEGRIRFYEESVFVMNE